MFARNYPKFFLLTILAVFFLVLSLPACKTAPPPAPVVKLPPPVETKPEVEQPQGLSFQADPKLSRLNTIIPAHLAADNCPGAVVVVGHDGKMIYRQAFGQRMVSPQVLPMTPDTIFDLASLTKVVATTTAVMQLVDAGKIDLDKPVANYWSAFGANGKGRVTIRNLMTHSSGLRADVNPKYPWNGYDGGMAAVAEDEPVYCPGDGYRYSDANFVALGEVVRRVSGQNLNVYCAQKIFGPLGMRNTGFSARSGPERSHRAHGCALGRGSRPHGLSIGRGGRQCRGFQHRRRSGYSVSDDPEPGHVSGQTDTYPQGRGRHDQTPAAGRMQCHSWSGLGHPLPVQPGF